ncbi:ComF family protein [Patescibacteria group bacterium]
MIEPYHNQNCVICGKKSLINPCLPCQKETKLKKLTMITLYDHKIVSKLIHIYKYNFAKEISKTISELIISRIKISELKDYTLVPVPLHKKRFQWREFNQADLIAEELSNVLKIPMRKNLLVRIKNTKPQAQIKDAGKRKSNIKGAFKIRSPKDLPQKVIVIDDVGTTFGTITECAKQLHKAGVKEVKGLVFAKG